MGEEKVDLNLLQNVDQRELFHLQNGLDITSVRDLVLELRGMDDETFGHHVNDDHNDNCFYHRQLRFPKQCDNFDDDRLTDNAATGRAVCGGHDRI